MDNVAIRQQTTRFVCVFNRARDGYQVPLALAEAGLLHRFVTDFYAPDIELARFLPGPLRRRQVAGLSAGAVRSVLSSFVLQSVAQVLRLPMLRVFAVTDAILASVAGRIAAHGLQALYCYHNYIPKTVPTGVPLVIFVYHPRRRADHTLLVADAEKYPEVVRSLAEEELALKTHESPIDWTRADAVVCASTFTARSVIDDGCDPWKITVIPYGIPPLHRSSIARPKAVSSAPRFLFVGQGVQRKGLHHLIRAWQLQDRGEARLTIVSYAIDPQIAALATAPGIELLGYQSKAALEALFDEADVFVMPSLVEGFGLVYLEALAHGCHVIGSPNSGLPDLALPVEAVDLISPGDVSAIANAIAHCIAKIETVGYDREAIRAAGAKWTQEKFRAAIAAHALGVLG